MMHYIKQQLINAVVTTNMCEYNAKVYELLGHELTYNNYVQISQITLIRNLMKYVKLY